MIEFLEEMTLKHYILFFLILMGPIATYLFHVRQNAEYLYEAAKDAIVNKGALKRPGFYIVNIPLIVIGAFSGIWFDLAAKVVSKDSAEDNIKKLNAVNAAIKKSLELMDQNDIPAGKAFLIEIDVPEIGIINMKLTKE